MAFQFAPSTSVGSQSFNAPQSAQMGAPVNSNPLSTLGDLQNIASSQQALKKSQATFGADVAKAQASSQREQVALADEQLAYHRKQLESAAQQQQRLMSKPDLNADDIIQTTLKHAKDFNLQPEAVEQALQGLPKDGKPKDYQAFLAQGLASTLSAQSQFDKLYPEANMTNVGGAIIPTAKGNQLTTGVAPGAQTGPSIATTIAPQVFANPITGQPTVIGGGRQPGSQPQMGGGNNVPLSSIAASNGNAQPQGNFYPNAQPQVNQQPIPKNQPAQNQLVQGANESPANFNNRVALTQNAYAKAQDQFNNPNSEFGHIPTIQNINKNVMTLLKDPSVDTGAVQNFLAGKTGKGNLSAKEQELAKFLEQRIQNLSIKSDKDAESKKAAFGTIGMKKEALMEVVRNDNAWVTQQDLQSKGILNNGGNSINPNYGKVSAFNNQFAQMSQNPNLMKYISLVGENPSKIAIDKDDHDAARKYFGKLSNEEKSKLELERQTLLKLVGGQ